MVRIFFLWLSAAAILVIGVPLFISSWGESPAMMTEELADIAELPPVKLYCSKSGQIIELPLEDYVAGVVSAEMPAEFPLEALKAQAVAARTYAVRQMRSFGGAGMSGSAADISDSPAVNQAWLDEAELQKRWGSSYAKYHRRIKQAVMATHGQIVCYDNEPITALFHAASAGRTASAKEVWGSDGYPYLTSVAAPEDSNDERIRRVKKIAWSDFLTALGEDAAQVSAAAGLVEVIDYTESGRVASVRAADRIISGSEARQLWGLRSANFTAEYADGFVSFTTYGYGHGVGMSQYGAAALAKQGRGYQAILDYFYTGTELKNCQNWIKAG